MKVLGAIFAGGMARRFGSDKAAALIDGVALLDLVAVQLRPHVDALAVSGRDWPGLPRIDDRPIPGLGPLGALAGALTYAEANGFDQVLSTGCDLPELPDNLGAKLAPAPAVIAGQPLLGLWPATLAASLVCYLEREPDRSMRSWIKRAGVRRVSLEQELPNINTPDDLARYLATRAVRQSVDPPPSR